MPDDFLFQPYTEEFAHDPYAVYRRMRQEHPLYYHQAWDTWIFSRYADIKTLVMDARLGRTLDHVSSADEIQAYQQANNWAAAPMHSKYVKVSILDSEGLLHQRLRRSVFKVFTTQGVDKLEGVIKTLVDAQINEIQQRDSIDFIEDFIAPVPGAVIGAVIGVPADDRPQLRIWSENIVQFFEPERTDEHRELAEQASTEFVRYLEQLIQLRQQAPQDDLVSQMIAWRHGEDSLSHDELISTVMTILMAGHGSTIDVSANGMLALLLNPGQMQLLRAAPGLIDTAVQEMFRYDAPLPYFHRYVLEEIQYQDKTFTKGTKLGFLYASASRDEQHFAMADIFDISRQPNRHLSFGGGVHHCLGNHLARLNMATIFNRLLERFPVLRLAVEEAELQYHPGCARRGLRHLPMQIR